MTTTLLPVPRPSRLRPWARVLLWAVALVSALLAASVLYVAAALSGGLDDLLDLSAPRPTDTEVVASREQALRDLRAVRLPVGGAPLATGESSGCRTGEHSWERDDAFDLACSAAVTVVVPQASFRADALALHDRLVADGWQPGQLALDGVVTQYAEAGTPDRTPAELPGAAYTRGETTLEVAWLSDGRGRVQPWSTDEVVWDPAPPAAPGLAVALTVQRQHVSD